VPLSTVRTLFVEATGRRDLLADTGPTGALFFLNAGQRYLDGKYETQKSLARHSVLVKAGQYVVAVQDLRTVKEVWLVTSSGRVELDFEHYNVLRTDNPALFSTAQAVDFLNIADSSYRGTSSKYGVAVNSLSPYSRLLENTEVIYGRDSILPDDDFLFKSIILMAPPDADCFLDLLGTFYQPVLTEDGDTSYWTERKPEVLVAAAAFIHELFLRNTEGVKDWLNSINELMFGELADLGELDGPDSQVMGG